MKAVARFCTLSIDRDVVFWNKSISSLVRKGLLHEAQRVFDEMPQRTVVSWNAIITGYVRNNDLNQARKLFDEMPQKDVVSWNLILSAYIRVGKIDEGRRFFDGITAKDAVSWNTMIGGYTKVLRMSDAHSLFEKTPMRNVVSWNTMITGYVDCGDLHSAKELFERMPARNSASWNAMVVGLVQNGELDEAARLLEKMGKGDVDAYNSLIAGYGQNRRVEDARRLFDKIPREGCCRQNEPGVDDGIKKFERNVVSWNTMIMCYVKDGNLLAAQQLFDEMPVRDIVSWNTLISGYVHASAIDKALFLFSKVPGPDVETWNSIISGLAQNRRLEDARCFFNSAPRKNLVSWNAIISGCEQNEDYHGALDLFLKMQECCLKPDKHTLSCVLSACAGLVALHQGKQIHQYLTKSWICDIPMKNSLITMYSKCGEITDARKVFDDMQLKDLISWNAIIGGYAHNGCAEEALLMFSKMKMLKVVPSHITFLSVLSACGHAGFVEEGRRHFSSMTEDFRIIPRMEHFASMVDIFGRSGLIQEAVELINEMPILPDRSVWGSLLSAAKIHANLEVAALAAQALIKLEPESSMSYVVLSNMYANAGKWNTALEETERIPWLRKYMK
ncbi:Pentatricopeptide repeat-containing protein [Nymphaea thermarum]|nr:Pentatricopeptide repeat-containing protein [Nymphaea thermarum]